MYIPPSFLEQRPHVLHAFIRHHSFATIITTTPDVPLASHVPIILLPDRGQFGALQFHLARQNPQWNLLAQATDVLVIFHGPHAYISPTWYKSAVAVPTWNYLAVHAYGRPRMLDDAQLSEHLRLLVSSYEPPGGWSTERMPAEVLEKMKRNIVGFEMEIERLEGKWKLNQNRPREDVQGAIEGLLATGDAESKKVAELMKQAMQSKG
jgi:transcriptional regulator